MPRTYDHPMARNRMHPDTALEISLTANARRLVYSDTAMPEAIEHLRTLSGGRTDVLASAAGLILGGYLASPGTEHPAMPLAASYLVLAGADPELTVTHTDTVRARVSRTAYSL